MHNYKKYLVGFAIFMLYYLIARRLENSVSFVKTLAGTSTTAAS